MSVEVTVIERPHKKIYGLWGKSSDKTIPKDIPMLSKQYYTTIEEKPKMGFIWSVAIGEAKRYVYTKWLQSSDYKALNMEYEYHTDKSMGRKPEMELFFALIKK